MSEIKSNVIFNQKFSFKGLDYWGKVAPSDIDGILDFNGKLFIILEGKYNGSHVPTGQKILFKNLLKATAGSSNMVIIIFSHNETSPNIHPVVKDCKVTGLYYNVNGKPEYKDVSESEYTVEEIINKTIKKYYNENT